MMSPGDRIALLMGKAKLTERELADKAKIGYMSLRRAITGYSEMPIEDLEKVADVLGVSVDYLLGKKSPGAMSEPISRIPVFRDFPEKNENGEYVSDKPTEYICGSYGYKDMKKCFFVIANDDSMSNAKITMGDKVLINPDKPVVSGDLAAVSINGEKPVIRRVFFDGTMVYLSTEGITSKTDIYDTKKKKVEFLGTVVFSISYPT